jgi:hypothetical protein
MSEWTPPDPPLPEEHTARKLGRALRAIPGVPEQMITWAEGGYYHDFLSPLVFPEMTLHALLRGMARDPKYPESSRVQLAALDEALVRGEYDATREESDQWAKSDEGREVFRELVRGASQRARKMQRGKRGRQP